MNVIVFQNRFEQPILGGEKNSTIRANRKDGRPRAKVGETISLRVWSGRPYNSKQREFAQRTVKFVIPVRVGANGITRADDGTHLSSNHLPQSLGFKDLREMLGWYKNAHGLPFDGVLVHFPK